MQNGYYATTGAMVTQFNRLDQISNNLANLKTNGFKKEDVVIGDFMRLFQQTREELPLENHTKAAAKFFNRTLNRVPHIAQTYQNFEVGAMKATGNSLDFALNDENLFFVIETEEGLRLTRDGSFALNDTGELVTKRGDRVVPDTYFINKTYISIPEDALDFFSDYNGELSFLDQTALEAPNRIARLMVVRVDDLQNLQREGDNYYTLKEGEIRQGTQPVEETRAVRQKMLEMSNVNSVREMTALIETNRLVQMYQKAMDTHMNQLNSDAVNKLATTKA